MNKMEALLQKFFYANNPNLKFTVINVAVIAAIMLAVYSFSSVIRQPALLGLDYILIFYAFMSLGKGGGLTFGFIFVFLNLISILAFSQMLGQLPHVFIMGIALVYLFFMARFLGEMEEQENRLRLKTETIDIETNEYREKSAKLKSVIDESRGTVKNYRFLNIVAQKLTSALERQVIVDIISEAVRQMIGNAAVKFALLIYSDETGMFMPAVEDKSPDLVLKGAVKIYKKDPFDEWIIANKFTLFLKDINDDFRFKDLKKELFRFRSMVAIPLIENKKIIGILKFYAELANAFDKYDARLLNYLGDISTTAVQNAILYQKTKDLAIRDGLTGLYLRKYFIERLDEEMRRAREANTALSFLLIDIDHFKDCNDTHGHMFGDKVLRILGEFLKDNLRDVDITGRYGGEEFAVILPSTAMNGSRFVAERLRENFSKLIINVNENEGIKLTLSVGGVQYSKTTKLMELINKADKALYYSKENGRNKVTFWEDIAT